MPNSCFTTQEIKALQKQVNSLQTSTSSQSKTITFLSSFTDDFSVDSSSLLLSGKLVNLTVTSTRTAANSLLNTTFPVGTIPADCYPPSPISGTFPYGASLTDFGTITLDASGNLSIRSGNDVSISNGHTFTFSLMYLI